MQNINRGDVVPKPLRWQPPAERVYKINVDATIFADRDSVGVGALVRDHEGQAIAAVSKRLPSYFPPLIAEAMAMRFAVGFAKDFELCSVVFEGDNLEVISSINKNDDSLSSVKLIIEDI